MKWLDSLPNEGMIALVFGALFAYAIGAGSGAYELLKYQKMSQDNILATDYGRMYWSINGGLAVAAYTVMNFIPEMFPEATKTRHFAQAFAAGTGSMALLRTKYLGFAEGIERWLTYIEERLNAELVQKNWEAIQEFLPGVGSKEELDIVFERLILESEFVLKQEQIVRIKTEIEKVRNAVGGETGRAYGLMRAYAEIVGIDRLLIVLATIRDRLEEFRRQRAQSGQAVGATPSLVVKKKGADIEVGNEKEFGLALESFLRSLGETTSADVREAIVRLIAAEKGSSDSLSVRLDRFQQEFARLAGLSVFIGASSSAQEALLAHRSAAG